MAAGDTNPDKFKYLAFISYSRKNERDAKWIHHALESFRIPSNLPKLPEHSNQVKHLRPLFRDRTDLDVKPQSFVTDIQTALEGSRFLVVLCSPHAAAVDTDRKHWIDLEIRHFIETHGLEYARHHILPVILSGEPGSHDPARECLPPALKQLGEDFLEHNFPTVQRGPEEQTPSRETREECVLQIASFLLNVSYATLNNRYNKAQRQKAQGQLFTAASVAILCSLLALWALVEKSRAQENLQVAQARYSSTKDLIHAVYFEQGKQHKFSADEITALEEILREHEVSINHQDPTYGFTLLAKAVMNSQTQLVEWLLKHGADPSISDTNGFAPLLYGAGLKTQAAPVILQKLIEAGADPTQAAIRNNQKVATPLTMAAASFNIEVAGLLLESGADVNEEASYMTPLQMALASATPDTDPEPMVRFLVEHGADVNKVSETSGLCALLMALNSEQSGALAPLLFELGADPNVQINGLPLLHFMISNRNAPAVQMLLEHGADYSVNDDEGQAVLLLAAKAGNLEILRILENAGIDIYQLDQDGTSYLYTLMEQGHEETALALIHESHQNFRTARDGMDILQIASCFGSTACVSFLLQEGYDVASRDTTVFSPLMFAAREDFPEVVNLLLSHGADVNLQHSDGQTALWLAAWNDNREVAKLLLANGADPSIANNDGVDAVTAARQNGHVEMVELLENPPSVPEDVWESLHQLTLALQAVAEVNSAEGNFAESREHLETALSTALQRDLTSPSGSLNAIDILLRLAQLAEEQLLSDPQVDRIHVVTSAKNDLSTAHSIIQRASEKHPESMILKLYQQFLDHESSCLSFLETYAPLADGSGLDDNFSGDLETNRPELTPGI